jgi:hypothetical protein
MPFASSRKAAASLRRRLLCAGVLFSSHLLCLRDFIFIATPARHGVHRRERLINEPG